MCLDRLLLWMRPADLTRPHGTDRWLGMGYLRDQPNIDLVMREMATGDEAESTEEARVVVTGLSIGHQTVEHYVYEFVSDGASGLPLLETGWFSIKQVGLIDESYIGRFNALYEWTPGGA
jgi:hypothetical protein